MIDERSKIINGQLYFISFHDQGRYYAVKVKTELNSRFPLDQHRFNKASFSMNKIFEMLTLEGDTIVLQEANEVGKVSNGNARTEKQFENEEERNE